MKLLAVLMLAAGLLVGLFACGGGDGSGGGSSHINLVPDSWSQYTRYRDWAARGTITNRGSDRAHFVKVLVDLLDTGGTIIGSDFAYVDTADTSIQPGQTVTFQLWAYGIKPASVAGIRRKVVWRDGDFKEREKTF